ncbi:hypothetical protein CEXT_253641 [Caerostris extrusa]|uniref:Uncharacterized protein n=1 Tax=Caerostris extrusa TaxID=172846 RepID=A0AAV4Q0F3_CAEEX|nr:hypothetical protein CEXT_253641 [Caerostris extrusa]
MIKFVKLLASKFKLMHLHCHKDLVQQVFIYHLGGCWRCASSQDSVKSLTFSGLLHRNGFIINWLGSAFITTNDIVFRQSDIVASPSAHQNHHQQQILSISVG